ncbi:antibiotic biosynthesis monooxygenase [Mycobacterium spongiae]|uniref:Antibiotic biosynthesis monooxygenase n=1 Tax=Mycobacterium spongiae TaxID=886343 RepID=A0A975JXJ6_9MYCO|nr:antibiotic biosynthesis monooxygenase [Mycobacterium spongiae]QUR67531.1 antibiotic biosynthesis monooxygenase [Mycobacterium spongiae]
MAFDPTAITLFHPPSDPEGFATWVAEYRAAARRAHGYVGALESVHATEYLDWALKVSFASAELLESWLDSAERQALLIEGQAQGYWRSAPDLIIAEGELPPANVAVFLHSVAPGKEAEFVAAHGDLKLATSAFLGYQGTAIFPADSSGQWMTVIRFRTAGQLTAWVQSPERRDALPQLRDKLTRDFAELSSSAPFGSTVRVADGQTRITPAWKTAMLVLLCLYPTATVITMELSPALNRLGLHQALTMFVGNVTSVALLQWILVPAVSRPFRRWLDPIDGATARVTLVGVAMVVLAYAALVLLFALTTS